MVHGVTDSKRIWTPAIGYTCGCTVFEGRIAFCPLHAAAEEMRDFFATLLNGVGLPGGFPNHAAMYDEARALLAKVGVFLERTGEEAK